MKILILFVFMIDFVNVCGQAMHYPIKPFFFKSGYEQDYIDDTIYGNPKTIEYLSKYVDKEDTANNDTSFTHIMVKMYDVNRMEEFVRKDWGSSTTYFKIINQFDSIANHYKSQKLITYRPENIDTMDIMYESTIFNYKDSTGKIQNSKQYYQEPGKEKSLSTKTDYHYRPNGQLAYIDRGLEREVHIYDEKNKLIAINTNNLADELRLKLSIEKECINRYESIQTSKSNYSDDIIVVRKIENPKKRTIEYIKSVSYPNDSLKVTKWKFYYDKNKLMKKLEYTYQDKMDTIFYEYKLDEMKNWIYKKEWEETKWEEIITRKITY